MKAITIHPQSNEQIDIFKALAKAFDIPFEVEDIKATEYENMLKESHQQAIDGKTTKIAIEDLWK